MATTLQLNNFRFSIYIDADGTVTLTDLPPELRDVAEALDPSLDWGVTCPVMPPPGVVPLPDRPSHSEHSSVAADLDEHRHSGPCNGRDRRTQS
jgi:hypothetical protein